MADLVTNLYLRTQHFDQSIQNVQKQLDALNKTLLELDKKVSTPKQNLIDFSGVLSSSLVSSLTKFAGGLGLAMSAGETFDKAMRSCQTTSDMLDNNLNAAKGTVDAFFRSLVTGDWTVFNDGLLATYNNLKDLSVMMDELADKKLSLSYIKASDLKDIEQYDQIVRDTNKSFAERQDAYVKMQAAGDDYAKKLDETIEFEKKALVSEYNTKYGLNFKFEDFDKFIKEVNFSGESTNEANAKYKEYVRLQNDLDSKSKLRDRTKNANINSPLRQKYQQEYEDAQKALALFKQQNAELMKQGALTEQDDAGRKQIVDTNIRIKNLEQERYSIQKRIDEAGRSLNSSSNQKTSTAVKVDTPAPVGSIAEMEKKIASLKKEFQNATTDGMRYGIQIAIEEAERELKMMRLRAQKMDLLPSGMKNVKAKNPLEGMDTSDLDKFRTTDTLFQKDESTLDYLTAIGALMSNISGATTNATSAWMNYFASILQGTVALLPLLASVFKIKAMEGIAEQSKLKFPLNLIAMAATAAGLVASIANVPKFASGGIVSGSSFVGDNVIARVNSGEMILNTRQQANLFSMLDGGARTNVQGTNVVKWRIEGRDLVGVLANQINKTSKYK